MDKSTLRGQLGKDWTYDEAIREGEPHTWMADEACADASLLITATGQSLLSPAGRRPSVASSAGPRVTGVNGRPRTRSFRSSSQPSVNEFNRSLGGPGEANGSAAENANPPSPRGLPPVKVGSSITDQVNGRSGLSRTQSQRKRITSTDILASLRVAADHSTGKHAASAPTYARPMSWTRMLKLMTLQDDRLSALRHLNFQGEHKDCKG